MQNGPEKPAMRFIAGRELVVLGYLVPAPQIVTDERGGQRWKSKAHWPVILQ